MAKPRIFLSSTCYDLSIVRAELDRFLKEQGFEVINSEDKSFGVTPGMHSHTACISAVEPADFFLLLIGGRYGGTYIGSETSITNEEYRAAEKLDIPRIVAVKRSVWDYRQTYKRNALGDHKHIVDDARIFSFIDYIASGHSDNWMHSFEAIEDIKKIITTQFSHYLYLFSRGLRRKDPKVAGQQREIVDFPTSLGAVEPRYKNQDEIAAFKNGIRGLYKIIEKIVGDETKKDAKAEKLKQLWVVGRYGDSADGNRILIENDRFKQYAWSTGKGSRINNQFQDYGITAYYNDDPENFCLVMRFKDADEDSPIAWALEEYVKHLLEKHDGADAFELFCRADMRLYSE